MRHLILTVLLLSNLLATGCGKGPMESSKGRLNQALAELTAADTPEKRFYVLGRAAKESFSAGKLADAQKYAEELNSMLPDFVRNRDYGTAWHDANMVLGRVAVRQGRLDDAKHYLVIAGQAPPTPQLMNYGPNMGLAKELLAKGEKQAVLDYLQACKKFWQNDNGVLDKWSQQISEGKTPEFGPNLNL